MIVVVENEIERKNLRIKLEGEMKLRWAAMLSRKKISQQAAIEGLVGLLLRFDDDDLLQSVLLGQIAPDTETISIILRRITDRETMRIESEERMAAKNKRK